MSLLQERQSRWQPRGSRDAQPDRLLRSSPLGARRPVLRRRGEACLALCLPGLRRRGEARDGGCHPPRPR